MDKIRIYLSLSLVLIFLFISTGVIAGMNSTNYIVVSEELDSGGGESNSSNYITTAVLGTTSGEVNSSGYVLQTGALYGATGQGIINRPPTISIISPNDGNVTTDRSPTFVYDGNDLDGDSLVYDINVTKLGISVCGDYNLDVVGHLEESYTFVNDLKCLSDNGDFYEWRVRACENETAQGLCSDWSSYRTINITSLVQISLPVDSINFGSMSVGESRNTTNSSYDALVLRNDGNCRINISINSTQIWESISLNTSQYLQSKVNSFAGNASWAETSWFGVPTISGLVVMASDLNYSDSTDSLPIDILIEAPGNEPPGEKNSTINLRAELSEVYGVA